MQRTNFPADGPTVAGAATRLDAVRAVAVVLAVVAVLTAGPWSYVALAVAGLLMLLAVRLDEQLG
jgi:hypothetical protein